jgi:hypothetical protein
LSSPWSGSTKIIKDELEKIRASVEDPELHGSPGDLEKRFGPGSGGCDMTGHAAYVAADTWHDHIMEDAATLLNPHCRRLAYIAFFCMTSVYQELICSELKQQYAKDVKERLADTDPSGEPSGGSDDVPNQPPASSGLRSDEGSGVDSR